MPTCLGNYAGGCGSIPCCSGYSCQYFFGQKMCRPISGAQIEDPNELLFHDDEAVEYDYYTLFSYLLILLLLISVCIGIYNSFKISKIKKLFNNNNKHKFIQIANNDIDDSEAQQQFV